MTAPKRVQLQRTKGWRKPEGTIVVSRPSRWGNPFRVAGSSSVVGPAWSVARDTWGRAPTGLVHLYSSHSDPCRATDHAVELFTMLLKVRERDEPDQLRRWLKPLRGHDLACWCPLDQPCHADALLKIANA